MADEHDDPKANDVSERLRQLQHLGVDVGGPGSRCLPDRNPSHHPRHSPQTRVALYPRKWSPQILRRRHLHPFGSRTESTPTRSKPVLVRALSPKPAYPG